LESLVAVEVDVEFAEGSSVRSLRRFSRTVCQSGGGVAVAVAFEGALRRLV
jgi:hypothetical protein